jgi:hypothetical protein
VTEGVQLLQPKRLALQTLSHAVSSAACAVLTPTMSVAPQQSVKWPTYVQSPSEAHAFRPGSTTPVEEKHARSPASSGVEHWQTGHGSALASAPPTTGAGVQT